MAGSGLGGLAEGLWGFVDRERQLSQERENTAAQKEAQLYSLLAEHGTDEFASMGLAGLAEMANPKRKAKGMRGFLGEMEASQTLPRIRELMATPQQRAVTTPGLPSKGIPADIAMRAVPQPPPSGAGLGGVVQPPPAPMQAGGLPEVLPQSQLGRGGPPPAPGDAFREMRGTPDVGRVDQVEGPRQVLMRPEDRISRDTKARERAEVEGEVEGYVAAGMDRTQALELVKQSRMRRGGVGGYGTLGEADVIPDPASPTGFSRPLYDKRTGQIMGSTPAMDPVKAGRGLDLGDAVESAAKELGYPSSAAVAPGPEMERVNARAAEIARNMSYQRGTGAGQAKVEQGLTQKDIFDKTQELSNDWKTASKTARTMDAAMATMDAGIEAVKRGDANAGGQAVLITFQKMLDPVSVVRESEYLRSAVGLTLLDRFQGMYERLIKTGGAGVPVEELQEFINVAKDIQARTTAALEPERQRILKTAQTFKLDPTLILPGYNPAPPAPGQPGGPPATATTSAAQYTPGLKYQHPVYGWVEVQDPPLNAQGKPRIKRTTPP